MPTPALLNIRHPSIHIRRFRSVSSTAAPAAVISADVSCDAVIVPVDPFPVVTAAVKHFVHCSVSLFEHCKHVGEH
jgi:hypothetical protein